VKMTCAGFCTRLRVRADSKRIRLSTRFLFVSEIGPYPVPYVFCSIVYEWSTVWMEFYAVGVSRRGCVQ
jgi:hypothetical protein